MEIVSLAASENTRSLVFRLTAEDVTGLYEGYTGQPMNATHDKFARLIDAAHTAFDVTVAGTDASQHWAPESGTS